MLNIKSYTRIAGQGFPYLIYYTKIYTTWNFA